MTKQSGIKIIQPPNITFGFDIVSVKPLSKPTAKLFYIDYTYIDKLKERRQKIEKLYERIRLQNGNIDHDTVEPLE